MLHLKMRSNVFAREGRRGKRNQPDSDRPKSRVQRPNHYVTESTTPKISKFVEFLAANSDVTTCSEEDEDHVTQVQSLACDISTWPYASL